MWHRDDISIESLPSLSAACARTAGLACACTGIIATAAFCITGDLLMTQFRARAVVERARVCAASLSASPNGDLRSAAERLRAQYKPLLAVASVGVSGDLQWASGALPVYRQAAEVVRAQDAEPGVATVSIDGEEQSVYGVSVALNGSDARSARKVFFLFRSPQWEHALLGATAALGGALAIGSLMGLCAFRCWFRRRVTGPLANLGQPVATRKTGAEPTPTTDLGGWREIQGLARTLRSLRRGLAASEAAVHRIEADSQSRLRDSERGFDRRLRRAEDRANLDPLTRLRNRAYLDANLAQIMATQQDRDEDVSFVMIDLDNFKQLNDTHGHRAGDDLLRCTGELFQATLRPTDHAIRYGGDEFLLILPGVDGAEALQITERILKLYAQSAALIDVSRSVTLSAGIASREVERCDDGLALIARADSALYAAKRGGKNSVALSSAACDQPAALSPPS